MRACDFCIQKWALTARDATMSQDIDGLTEKWIQVFGEPPAIVDADLMRALLAAFSGEGEEARES